MRNEVSRRNVAALGYLIVTLLSPLLGRKSKCCFEKLKEGGFARVTGANDKNTDYRVSGS
jgi:hypothetical protein